MIDKLRILHCADIHLDDAACGRASQGASDSRRDAFVRALHEMRTHDPAIMLLAGDLFDSNTIGAETVEWAMATLCREKLPIVMIPGNHDCMEPGAIFSRYDFNRIPNVTMIASPDGSLVHFPDLGLVAWGKAMVEHSRSFRPLGGCPDRPDCRWYVGLGHGFLVQNSADRSRSSPIHMHEIEASPCDYLALGHHHAAMEIISDKATAAYSGSPTDQIGRGATYVIVDLAIGKPPVVAIRTIPPPT